MGKKRVFILGAGFSKQAGMPLATELTSLILNADGLAGLDEMQEWVGDLRERLMAAQRAGKDASSLAINVEQLFEFAKYDEELWRMRQQECPVGRTSGETPWQNAQSISTWLDYMEEQLVHAIWNAQRKASTEPIERFAAHLSTDDTIVTFNYDTLLEAALTTQGKAWNHGLSDSDNGGVAVLKMHGSIDWLLLERNPEKRLDNFIKLFSKTDTNVDEHGSQPPMEEDEYASELWRAKNIDTCGAMIQMDESGISNFWHRPGLAGLGAHKPLHKLPGSSQTWSAALKALPEADELCIVGFSMSPYDTMTRFHFTSFLRTRKCPPQRTVVVDPNAVRLADSFCTVFGDRLTLVTEAAQDVDWAKIMS